MKEFLFTYHGGQKPASPEEGAANMQKWKEWVANIGDAAVYPNSPLSTKKTVKAEGVSDGVSTQMLGFSIFKAEDMEAALAIAQSCPFLEVGGSIEVSEMMQM